MSRINSQRKSCIDVFNAFLVTLATYAGIFEFPCIKATYDIPNKLILFSKCMSCKDYNQWVHFMRMIICLSVSGEIHRNTWTYSNDTMA